jgi:hypothetical protein
MAEIETISCPIPTPLDVTALAKRLGVARTTIQRRLKKGREPPTERSIKIKQHVAGRVRIEVPVGTEVEIVMVQS